MIRLIQMQEFIPLKLKIRMNGNVLKGEFEDDEKTKGESISVHS